MNMEIGGDARLLAHRSVLPFETRLRKAADFCVDIGWVRGVRVGKFTALGGYGFSDF